jgi:hypothetical protein
MIHEDTDVIFPPRVIPVLRDLRGESWKNLVSQVTLQPVVHPDRLAFVLFMARIAGCVTCHADSFRAMRGCTQCAIQTVRRHRGDDQELIKGFVEAQRDVSLHLDKSKGTQSNV